MQSSAFNYTSASSDNDNGQTTVTQPAPSKRSSLISRNVTVNNHRTSVRLEPDMWSGLREICRREHASLHDLSSYVAAHKPANTSLTAALRVFVMAYFRAAATEDGHSKAGHGPGGSFLVAWNQRPAANHPSKVGLVASSYVVAATRSR
ncbi:MAG: ribbon-helix-helix domain-containing protein [Alphaproteobacteria bacterium]|nr:ribbon-helix-helix domain-containing protein [Alphaproteobacteria bacterium]